MIALWVAAGVLSAIAAGLVLYRAALAARAVGSADPTLATYRRQLHEIDDLAARGLLATDEVRAAHSEAGRRLLHAADQAEPDWQAPARHRAWVLASVGIAATGALVVYLAVGSPLFPDQPIRSRIATWRAADLATLTAPEMAAVLRMATQQKPDVEGYRFLALAENQSDNPHAAAKALRKAIALAPQRPDLWEMLGVSLVGVAGGDETSDAIAAFRTALSLDPSLVLARFHLARAMSQSGNRQGAVEALSALRSDLPAGDDRRESLDRAIEEAKAATVSPKGNDQMIAGMVAGLAKRLEANPDDPEGWIRLVRSYAVLGDSKARDAALERAKSRYSAKPDMLQRLVAAAKTEPMR